MWNIGIYLNTEWLDRLDFCTSTGLHRSMFVCDSAAGQRWRRSSPGLPRWYSLLSRCWQPELCLSVASCTALHCRIMVVPSVGLTWQPFLTWLQLHKPQNTFVLAVMFCPLGGCVVGNLSITDSTVSTSFPSPHCTNLSSYYLWRLKTTYALHTVPRESLHPLHSLHMFLP